MNKSAVAALTFPGSPVSGFTLHGWDSLFAPRTGFANHSGRANGTPANRTVTMPSPDAGNLPQHAEQGVQAPQDLAQPGADLNTYPAAPTADPAALSSAEQDRLLVQAALGGDQLAFGELVTRYQSAVYNMAYRMLGDPTEAEDAAQEVFVRAWNQLHTFQLDRRFSTWLLSIASHYSIDLLRRRKPQAPLDDVALFVQSDDPEPEELAIRSEQSDMVRQLLDTLPDKYRSVTVLRYYNDLSYDEIARVTGLTESAVKTQLHRARKMLAEEMAEVNGRR
ncbi:MAG: sigma-70 family RNA polymerase sigma factor [Chloroflexota bacterium]|nr:sigma-70 family RNA polymerase sigma factor [Chloroflexota bacterium]